ncbi:MAG: CoA transferase subunit A [Firmicutes bacterium]|nr:CoA transferase subunit A [Bacillota bacterium]
MALPATATQRSKVRTIQEALSRVVDGSSIMVGGFGLAGCPWPLIDALAVHGARSLTIISNDLGSPGVGLGKLLTYGLVKKVIGTYYTWNPEVSRQYLEGLLEVELVPQGTFVERIRAAGVGLGGFYTPTAVGTELAEGKETRVISGREHVLEFPLRADVALVKCHKADTLGNLVYRKTARNFNPLMAMAADYVIAHSDYIVQPGELDPEAIVTPQLFVDVVVHGGTGNEAS